MKKLTHTENFIKIVERVIDSVNPYHFMSENPFKYPGSKEAKLRELTYCYYIIYYHLTGWHTVKKDSDAEYEKYIENYHGKDRYKDIILDALKSDYPSYKIIGDEFWELCPEPAQIKEYIPIFKTRLNNMNGQIPRAEGLTWEDMIFGDNFYTKQFNIYRSQGLIDKADSEYMLVKIAQIIQALNRLGENIRLMFDKFELMASGGRAKIDYEQLRKDLIEYISGVSKADLEFIMTNGILSQGANKPTWIGNRNEGWKFMKWFNWSFPSFNAIFDMKGGRKLEGNDNNKQQGINKADERDGVCKILREYMPDHKI